MEACYIITVVITALVCSAASAVLIYQSTRMIMRQVKLKRSINLVELNTNKIVYWVFAGLIGVLIFYLIAQMANSDGFGDASLSHILGVGTVKTNIALMFVLILLMSAEVLIVTLGLSRNAVVDKGVYTNYGMMDWHRVRDYVIDEERGLLVLTSDRRTFSTLNGLTPPFRVKKSDIQKLKFILNKNKNKFSGFENE